MSEDQGPDSPAEPQLPTYVIEGARSSRSRCKTCRRKIDKGVLRLGVLIEGPYGTGYLWHHLKCAARRQFDHVREAYREEAWRNAKQPPDKIPDLAVLEKHQQKAEERRSKKKDIPYLEVDPSGRAKCKHCGETLEKGRVRAILGRGVYFGNQVRVAPITVHLGCVAGELDKDDCETEAAGLIEAFRENSGDFDPALFAKSIEEIGELPQAEEPPAPAGDLMDIKPDI